MNEAGAKQQIVEKIKSNSNILVTVNSDPSVDELSAALGLTILLNKMKKHATAVFSGSIPPAITFLDPQKTFENTVDSLRDFIIALDKEKADHLRYKVEGEVVKIFITPYRTTITDNDLEFSQGDYNVELVLALGVKSQDHLDSALEAHGRILHDATVATIGAGGEKSQLGSIDWREDNASSLSEMIVTLSDSLKSDRPLLDEQIATAFLTGLVAATDRFSNNRTSSKVMTIAAQLMAAGANQQLIASKLEEASAIGQSDSNDDNDNEGQNSDGTTDLAEGKSSKVKKEQSKKARQPEKQAAPEEPKPKEDDGSLIISHEKQGDLEEVTAKTVEEQQSDAAAAAEEELAKQAQEVPATDQADAAKVAEQNLAEQLQAVAPATADTPSVADLQQDIAAASAEVDKAVESEPAQPLRGAVSQDAWKAPENTSGQDEPAMGGTLNATTEQAAEEARRAEEDKRNHTILSHNNGDYVGDSQPTYESAFNAVAQKDEEPPMIDPLQEGNSADTSSVENAAPTARAQTIQPPTATLAELDEQNRMPHEEARAAVDAALSAPQADALQTT